MNEHDEDFDLSHIVPWRPMSDSGVAALSQQSGVKWAKVVITPEGNTYGEMEGDTSVAYEICQRCGEYKRLENPPRFPITYIKDRHAHEG